MRLPACCQLTSYVAVQPRTGSHRSQNAGHILQQIANIAAKLATAADRAKMQYLIASNLEQKGTVRLSCQVGLPQGVIGDTPVLEQEDARPAEKCVVELSDAFVMAAEVTPPWHKQYVA